ncbi:MAG: TrbI/VirB10 family protein [Vicinamibacterales bacterium]|nr:TrbI/VirB10 family protein [Vicinamibacterales bacterium]
MEINRAAVGALAVVGIIAAGGGAYIANRQVDSEPSTTVTESDATAGVPGSVNETENSIVLEPASPAEQPVAPRATAAPAPRPSAPAPAPVARRQAPEPRMPSAPPPSSAPSVPVDPPIAAAVEPVDTTTVERAPYVPPVPQKLYEDLVIPADSVIGLQIDNAVTSERAKVEDQVRARVTRDVKVRDQVAIPAGTRAEGSITLVEKGGRLKDQARLGIRFHTIVLADGTRLPINTETIYREGDSPAKESAAKIGGAAVGGAVLGAILGGKKGAIIGTTVGAGAGGAAVAASEPSAATLPAGSTVTVRMSAPATVTVEK